MEIVDFPSPNQGPRRGVAAPNMVILHYTGMVSAALALARLCSPQAEVSAHYLIDESGQVYRLVSEAMRAWHAGASAWGEITDVNSNSIGIELSNPGHEHGLPDFTEAQMASLENLLLNIRLRWSIPPERYLGHADVAVGRKQDPGEKFDWKRLAARRAGIWSEAEAEDGPGDFGAVATAARRLGYRWEDDEAGRAALLRALQMRFEPEATGGPPSARLAARVADLAARHPVGEGEIGGPKLG